MSLQSAVERMTGDDWVDAMMLLHDITGDIGPRLSRLRTAASDRFDEHSRHVDFDAMRTGQQLFPDERLPATMLDAAMPAPPVALDPPRPPSLNAPNAKVGAQLVARHGGIDQAMMAYEPDSPEFDHIQAYRYVSTGKRPTGWIPPIVSPDDHP